MYQPEAFRTNDSELVRDLVREFPFATLLTGGASEINSLPLLLCEDQTDRLVFEGHVAAGNPVADAFGTTAIALFQGPDAYISPRWYRSAGQVPTWNYAVVHVTGKLVSIDTPEEVLRAMGRLVHRFEGESGWSMTGLSERARDGMLAAIRYFRFEVERTDVKIKLSQNRSPEDRASVLHQLELSPDLRHHSMARYLRRLNGDVHS